ncbi:zinc finger protein 654 isoform X2 [Pleurodeles waltl]|uniref:zinc finger protein 654 isoform X2 n=1 Tax=Pleurodeles waltl TaxID=8319 RepID=UPI0037097D1C
MAEDESDQEWERMGEELVALQEPPRISSREYCRLFCEVVHEYAGRWQVPLPQLQVLQTALCCFTSASVSYPPECEHLQNVLRRLALSLFELLLFFGKDEFYETPLKGILESIQDCNDILMPYENMELRLVTQIMKDGGPWESPVLQAILKGKDEPLDLVNKYLSSEDQLFFELRVRYLIACERTTEAVALITSCLNHPDVSKNLYYHQAYFTCLHMAPCTDGLLQEHVLRICCSDGIDIICSTEKEGKTALALKLCEAFLQRQLHSGDMYRIWDLIFIWSKLQIKTNSSKELFVHRCYQLLRNATNIRVIFPFMKIIINEVGESGIQLAIEICGCALQLDLRGDPYTKVLIYKTIAHLLPTDLEICRICVLSVFFLERCVDSYEAVERLYERPDEDYNEYTSSIENRVRFELLPILKKGLVFDPEFWNFTMIKQNCAALLGDRSADLLRAKSLSSSGSGKTCRKQQETFRGDKVRFIGRRNGELENKYVSLSRTRRETLAKKTHIDLGTCKIDHSVQKHRCLMCNKEFLGGHIMRHAHTHQKKGCFTCVICGRKFRSRAVMLKHLKDHVKKMKRQKLTIDHFKETVVKEKRNICDSLISGTGNPEVSKDCNRLQDNETATQLCSVVDTIKPTNAPSVNVTLNHVSEHRVFENGSLNPTPKQPCEPLIDKDLDECEETLKRESLPPLKINGSLCHSINVETVEIPKKLKCPVEGCICTFKRIRFLSEHVEICHPSDLNAEKHMRSLKETYALEKHARFKCPGPGCDRVFRWIGSLNRHAMTAHPEDFNIQQKICFPKGVDAVGRHIVFKCPSHGCVRVFKRIATLYKHAKNDHPDDLTLQLQLFSPIESDTVIDDKPDSICCPVQGCKGFFNTISSFQKHTKKFHSHNFDLQQQQLSPSEGAAGAVPGTFHCPSQGCMHCFKEVISLNQHAKEAHSDDVDLQQQVQSLSLNESQGVDKSGTFRCPGQGCLHGFKRRASLNKYVKETPVDNLDPQPQFPSLNTKDTLTKPTCFRCPGQGCFRVFNKVKALNKHASISHPTDLKAQQHIMAFYKGKCRFCQRQFENVQHFVDHQKKHVYPNIHFCLHINCGRKFKLASELLEHSSVHTSFEALCSYPGCFQVFVDPSRLYEHEAEHYSICSPEKTSELIGRKSLHSVLDPSSLNMEQKVCQDAASLCQKFGNASTESICVSQDQKEKLDQSVPSWKARKDHSEPKTYTQSAEKKTSMVFQSGSENSSANASIVSLVDQMSSVLKPVSESGTTVFEQLVNGHVEQEPTALISLESFREHETVIPSPEKKNNLLQSDSQNVDDIPSASPLPVKQKTQNSTPSYGAAANQTFTRPLPTAYLDELYLSMPKRRKVFSDNSNTQSVLDDISKRSSERLRCKNCLTTYCNSEALEAHLAQKKCQSLFGFDSDEENTENLSSDLECTQREHTNLNAGKDSESSTHSNKCKVKPQVANDVLTECQLAATIQKPSDQKVCESYACSNSPCMFKTRCIDQLDHHFNVKHQLFWNQIKTNKHDQLSVSYRCLVEVCKKFYVSRSGVLKHYRKMHRIARSKLALFLKLSVIPVGKCDVRAKTKSNIVLNNLHENSRSLRSKKGNQPKLNLDVSCPFPTQYITRSGFIRQVEFDTNLKQGSIDCLPKVSTIEPCEQGSAKQEANTQVNLIGHHAVCTGKTDFRKYPVRNMSLRNQKYYIKSVDVGCRKIGFESKSVPLFSCMIKGCLSSLSNGKSLVSHYLHCHGIKKAMIKETADRCSPLLYPPTKLANFSKSSMHNTDGKSKNVRQKKINQSTSGIIASLGHRGDALKKHLIDSKMAKENVVIIPVKKHKCKSVRRCSRLISLRAKSEHKCKALRKTSSWNSKITFKTLQEIKAHQAKCGNRSLYPCMLKGCSASLSKVSDLNRHYIKCHGLTKNLIQEQEKHFLHKRDLTGVKRSVFSHCRMGPIKNSKSGQTFPHILNSDVGILSKKLSAMEQVDCRKHSADIPKRKCQSSTKRPEILSLQKPKEIIKPVARYITEKNNVPKHAHAWNLEAVSSLRLRSRCLPRRPQERKYRRSPSNKSDCVSHATENQTWKPLLERSCKSNCKPESTKCYLADLEGCRSRNTVVNKGFLFGKKCTLQKANKKLNCNKIGAFSQLSNIETVVSKCNQNGLGLDQRKQTFLLRQLPKDKDSRTSECTGALSLKTNVADFQLNHSNGLQTHTPTVVFCRQHRAYIYFRPCTVPLVKSCFLRYQDTISRAKYAYKQFIKRSSFQTQSCPRESKTMSSGLCVCDHKGPQPCTFTEIRGSIRILNSVLHLKH